MVQRLSRLVARSMIFSTMLTVLERVNTHQPHLLRVLTYHRIDEPGARPWLCPGLISATPTGFEHQIRHLATHYHVITMAELLDAYRNDAVLPPRAVLITFDDAYRDFAEYAWPTLKRYHVPATLFVPTAYPDHPEQLFWWDRLYYALTHTARRAPILTTIGALPLATPHQRMRAFAQVRDYAKTLPHQDAMAMIDHIVAELGAPASQDTVLGWHELRQLVREGLTLGAHTRTHPLLNRIPITKARDEVLGSLADLAQATGSTLPVLAYPSGGFNEHVVQMLAREGVALAFTTVGGINDMRTADPLRLRRINIGQRTTIAILRARLLPWSIHLNRWYPLIGT